ncbi:DNA-packaging protein [Chenggangzhangella methanolivorans]|uniref:DNA-packaging protein n=1 Tax=Chenggangzhangella methanolivorans TaxID=1437009 RepID=UPI00360C3F23
MRLRSVLRSFATNAERDSQLAALTARDVALIEGDWALWARRDQCPPAGDWTTWLVLGGRGAGKTRAGAEWTRGVALGRPGFAPAAGRIALVAETYADLREVMIDGPSGLRAICPGPERPRYEPTRKRLLFRNGAVAHGFSAEDPEALRGPQFDAAWCDEIGKWRHGEEAWDMLQFGLRLGARPRQVATTTPRATPLVKRLVADGAVAVTRAATKANAANLAPGFLQAVVGAYAGTRLGRQELDGELIEDRDDALWSREAVERARVAAAPALRRIVAAVDPPASSGKSSDACGLVAAGLGEDGRVYVLADETLQGARPELWAARAVALWRRLEADALVAEVNQGGEMVRAVISGVDPSIPVIAVRATRGKWLRAEPVAALYAQGRVSHVGPLPALEDEMAGFGLDGLSNGRSPDRVDALVWAVSHLMFAARGRGPRVLAL